MPKIFNLVTDGNSLTSGGTGTSTALMAWPHVCRGLLIANQVASHPNAYWSIKMAAVSGQTTPQRTSAFVSTVHIHHSTAYGKNIVTFFDVTNDIILNNASVDAAIANVQTYVRQARNYGWKVMLSTVPPCGQTVNQANTRIPQFNTWLRANPQWSDFPIVELASHPSLDDPTDTNFFHTDQLHLNDAGYAVVADQFKTALTTNVGNGVLTTLSLTKRIVDDFDQLEKNNNSRWVTAVAAITTPAYRRMFQGSNMDRRRYRYQVYGYSDSTLNVVYNQLLAAYGV